MTQQSTTFVELLNLQFDRIVHPTRRLRITAGLRNGAADGNGLSCRDSIIGKTQGRERYQTWQCHKYSTLPRPYPP